MTPIDHKNAFDSAATSLRNCMDKLAMLDAIAVAAANGSDKLDDKFYRVRDNIIRHLNLFHERVIINNYLDVAMKHCYKQANVNGSGHTTLFDIEIVDYAITLELAEIIVIFESADGVSDNAKEQARNLACEILHEYHDLKLYHLKFQLLDHYNYITTDESEVAE